MGYRLGGRHSNLHDNHGELRIWNLQVVGWKGEQYWLLDFHHARLEWTLAQQTNWACWGVNM